MIKKLLAILIFSLVLVSGVFAASSQTETHYTNLPGDVDVWVISWTAHTDGSYTNYSTQWNVDGYVFMVVTDPGATAPQDLYDITLLDSNGIDVMGGELANRSATATEQAVPKIDAVYGTRFVRGPLTVTISGNNVNSAIGDIIIYIWGGK